MEHVIKKMILIAGAWSVSGRTNETLEREFAESLDLLQRRSGLDREKVVELLQEYISGESVA